jgi:hypothetical protein
MIVKNSAPIGVPVLLLCIGAVVAYNAVRKYLDEWKAYNDANTAVDPHLAAALEDVDRLRALQAASQAKLDGEMATGLAEVRGGLAFVQGIGPNGSLLTEGTLAMSCLGAETGEEWVAALEKHKALFHARHKANQARWDARLAELSAEHGVPAGKIEVLWKELFKLARQIEEEES